LDEEQGFRGVVHLDRFKAVLAQVAKDIATTSGLTRKINNEEGFRTYVNEAEAQIEKTKTKGSFSPQSLLNDEKPEDISSRAEGAARSSASRSAKPSTSIIPRGFACSQKHDRVHAIFNELKSMNILQQRNATGVMVRVLLDIALWSFIKDVGHANAVCDHFDPDNKRRKNNPDWTPPLRDLISYAVEKRIFPGMTADGYKSVRSLASKDSAYIITIDGFNAFTHNPYVTPTEGDLRALWQRAEPMLEIILH